MKQWILYDWTVREQPAVFEVDPSYSEPAAGYDTLLYCFAEPSDGRAAAFSKAQARRLDGIPKKLEKILAPCLYVGRIRMTGQCQFYFYAQDETRLEALELFCEKERAVSLSSGRAHEPQWPSYFQLLYPDAAKYQTILNGELIERMRHKGDTLVKIRRLTFFLFFPSEPCRLLFQEQARRAGFAIGEPTFRPELSEPYGLSVYALSSLEKAQVDALTTRAIRAAAHQGGVLLNWSAPVERKR